MIYNFLLYIHHLLAFLAAAAGSMPFLIALGLIIGRRGHAAFCIYGSRRLCGLALGLACAALFYFPSSYLAVVLPYGLHASILDGIFLPAGRPWLVALLCWLLGIFILWLASGSLKALRMEGKEDRYQFRFIRPVFMLLMLASLAFFAALFMENWPFAGLPEGMNVERAAMAIARHSMRRFFMSFSPAGAIALLYASYFFSRSGRSGDQEEERGSLRWFSFWAAAGAVPSLFISWALQLLSWNRAALPGLANTNLIILGLILQSMAAGLWIWIFIRPKKAGTRVILAFLLALLKSFWPLFIRSG